MRDCIYESMSEWYWYHFSLRLFAVVFCTMCGAWMVTYMEIIQNPSQAEEQCYGQAPSQPQIRISQRLDISEIMNQVL